MSMTRRIVGLLLSLSLLLAPGSSAMAMTDGAGYTGFQTAANLNGCRIEADDVTAAFAGSGSKSAARPLPFRREISISEDRIRIKVQLDGASSERSPTFTGRLYRSHRWCAEQPVYVAALWSDQQAYRCVYFEISSSDAPFQRDPALRQQRSITFYIQDEDKNLYDLSSVLETMPQPAAELAIAPAEVDFSWYLGVISGRYQEAALPPDRSMHTGFWAGDLHSLTFQIADYEHRYLACPYVDILIGDVPTAGNQTWWMALKISESASARRLGTDNWVPHTGSYSRCFLIDQAQLAWTAGGNTKITYVTPHLNCSAGSGGFSFSALVGMVSALLPQTATLAAILTAADAIINPGSGSYQSVTNNSSGGFNGGAYKMKFPASYYIDVSGYGLANNVAERFELAVQTITVNSSLTRKYQTYANADFNFRLAWSDLSGAQSGTRNYVASKSVAYLNNF